ncbi:motility associated factor glycosyltransferase family protein [uncultured Clostridium sp.]|uniref:motility associated factor glycosyltransferase family protein n=1 Tax=uncultured Clostridium sp. TaxID=59620 RepID=UPI0025DD2BEB|nr:6-hydroxymethylpterin diphosphokinase MptE-like protein [uncultured Clostridium sp.]
MNSGTLRIEKSKDNYDLAKININEKWVYIGSKYNMKNEIDKFITQIKKDDLLIIFGFGAGEHIKTLRKKFIDLDIIIFEPNKDIKKYAEDLEWIKKDKRIWIEYYTKDSINEKLNFMDEFNITRLKILPFSNYAKLYNKEFLEFMEMIKFKLYDCISDRNTKFGFKEIWFNTTIKNIVYMAKSVIIDEYENVYKDKPAIIVSAGPSLDKNIDKLKGIENNFFIITGGRPLKGLIDKKINPGLLVALDPQEVNYNLVKGYIENTNIPLLFFNSTNEKIVENHNGYKIFSVVTEEINDFLNREYKTLQVYGSVAHSMVSAAILLGCNPIIFVGQDFAYTNESAHSEYLDTKHNSAKFDEVKSDLDIWVESVDNRKVRTSVILNSYRLGMEKIIAGNPKIKFINATEGGARIIGTEEMKLSEVIKKYGNKKIEPFKEKKPDRIICKKITDGIDKMYDNLMKVEKKCKKGIEYTYELENLLKYNKTSKINELLDELDKIDCFIKEKMSSFLIIQSLLYSVVYEILTNKNMEQEKNKEEKLYEIVRQSRKLYESIKDVIEEKSDDFLNAKKELKNIEEVQ